MLYCGYKKWLLFFLGLLPLTAFAGAESLHSDPIAPVILGVTTIFFFAVIGRYVAHRFNQPGVLGELLMGVFLGNLFYFFNGQLVVLLREGSSVFSIMNQMLHGDTLPQAVDAVISSPYYAKQVINVLSSVNGIEYLKIAYVTDTFARYGVIFLLFMVGLESSVDELKKTGKESAWVAVIGVLAPMGLGFVAAYLLLPHSTFQTDLFVAATLSATSIGITARVLRELKQMRSREAHTILGAAMLDDILGLILLAIVTSIVVVGEVRFLEVIRISMLSVLFFASTLLLGPIILRKAVHYFRFLELWESKLFIAFLFVMALSWLASLIQLATIIGAFAAGVILHDDYFKVSEQYNKDKRSIQHLIAPLEAILAPMFFVVIGIQVKLETFFGLKVFELAIGLLIAAILGKLISGLGANRKDDRLLIGIGMLPRGEVGLVFASIGRTLGVISDELFSAVVLMVIVTTFLAPPLLKRRYARKLK